MFSRYDFYDSGTLAIRDLYLIVQEKNSSQYSCRIEKLSMLPTLDMNRIFWSQIDFKKTTSQLFSQANHFQKNTAGIY